MVSQTALALFLFASPLPAADTALALRVPPPSVLAELRSRHRPGHWLRVTTADARLDLRARVIDADGLGGLSTRSRELPAGDAIAWAAIERIDRLHSRRLRGQITGGLLGAIVGPALGGWIGTQIPRNEGFWDAPTGRFEIKGNQSQMGMLIGLVAGTAGGAWLGGRRGERVVEERPLYVARPEGRLEPEARAADVAPDGDAGDAASGSATAVTDTATSPGPGADAVAPAPPGLASAPPPRGYRRVPAERMLRVFGDFGRYQGTASRVTPAGLEQLRPDPDVGRSPELPALVTWDRIDRVEMHGTWAGRGAAAGGVTVGALGGLAGLAIVGALGGSDAETFGGLALGASVGGAVGALFGGLAGSVAPRWNPVYERRATRPGPRRGARPRLLPRPRSRPRSGPPRGARRPASGAGRDAGRCRRAP